MKAKIKRLIRDKAFTLLIILILLWVASMIMSSGVLDGAPIGDMFTKGFMAKQNLLSIFYKLVIQMFMMCGLACILISGNIDLSVAAQATLGSLIFARLCAETAMPWGFAFVITLVIGICFGLVNTVLVNFFKFPAFIATIGASSIYSGLCNILTGGNNVQIARPSFLALGAARVGIFPVIFLIALAILIIVQFVLSKTSFGRSLFMAGGNRNAARLAGLNPNRLRMILFIINSIMSVTGGILWCSQVKLASPTSIINDAPNMTAISAAVLGGVAYSGGAGNLIGPFIAIVLINAFESMLNVLQINAYWVVLSQGVLLILALLFDYFSENRRQCAMLAAAIAD